MDKGKRIKIRTTCPESQRENLNRFLVFTYNYYVHASGDTYPHYKIMEEYEKMCSAYLYLNDNGVRLMALETVRSFASMLIPVPKGKTAWQVFEEYLKRVDTVIEFIPDQEPTKTTIETLQDA